MEIIAIILFNVAMYWPVIKYSEVIDDGNCYRLIKNHPIEFTNWKSFLRIIRFRFYGAGMFGHNLPLDHAVTTALHTLACILMYIAFGSNQISFLAALLYACNPINNQTSIWLNGRRYLVNINLVLIMFLFGAWALPLYFLMPFLQINAIFSPILLGWQYALIVPIFFLIGNRRIIKWFKKRYRDIPNGEMRNYSLIRIIPITKSYGFYFWKMLFPGVTLMYYKTLYFWGINKEGNEDAYRINFEFFKGLAALIISISVIFILKDKLLLMWVFMVLATLQWSNVITATAQLADRYASMPNVFMMFFLSYFLHTYISQYALPIIGVFIGYYICQLNNTKCMFKDLRWMCEYNNYFYPENISMREFFVGELLQRGDLVAAWDQIRFGLHYNPNDFKFLFYAATCKIVSGDIAMAKIFAKRAENNYYLGQEEKLEKEFMLPLKLRLEQTDMLLKQHSK